MNKIIIHYLFVCKSQLGGGVGGRPAAGWRGGWRSWVEGWASCRWVEGWVGVLQLGGGVGVLQLGGGVGGRPADGWRV